MEGQITRPRLVFDKLQRLPPEAYGDQQLADHDLKYLLKFFSQSRSESYKLLERPDEQERTKAAPDYIVRELASGRLIAIERTQLMKQDVAAAIDRLIKGGADFFWGPPISGDIGKLLHDDVVRKIARGQLNNADVDERILLIRNRLGGISLKTFQLARAQFTDNEKGGVDHCYIIVWSQLLKLW